MRSPAEGADTVVWLCLEVGGRRGWPGGAEAARGAERRAPSRSAAPAASESTLAAEQLAHTAPAAPEASHRRRPGAGAEVQLPGPWLDPKTRTHQLPHPSPLACAAPPSLTPQEARKLEPGAFYLDRAPQAKHLTLSGTQYPDSAAAALVDKLMGLAGLDGGGGGRAAEEGADGEGAAREPGAQGR